MGTPLGGKMIGNTPPPSQPFLKTDPTRGQPPVYKPFPDELPGGGGSAPTPPKTSGYARGGFVKGEGAMAAHYAEGGPVTGRTRSFMKEPDPFSAGMAIGDSKFKKMTADPGSPQDYAGGKPKGKSKADVTTPMPRK